jgi:hypothetical protein
MNERIKELARQAGFNDFPNDENGVWITDGYWNEELERFADLVRQDEREACAKALQPMLRDMISRSQAAEIIRGRTE